MLRKRIFSSMDLATGTQQLVPSQAFFVQNNAIGRFQTDLNIGAQSHANLLRRHPDGTVDMVRLEPNLDHYLEMDGHGGRDIAIGRI